MDYDFDRALKGHQIGTIVAKATQQLIRRTQVRQRAVYRDNHRASQV
jgi:hypothetical protein